VIDILRRTAACLAVGCLSQAAHAWPTAREAVEQFLAFELGGGRLRAWPFQQYFAVPADYDEPGWDAVSVVRSHKMKPLQCKPSRCTAEVSFTYAPLSARPTGGREVVRYVAVQVDGEWLIEPNGNPRISEAEYIRRFPGAR
jgi:hypothetical protein